MSGHADDENGKQKRFEKHWKDDEEEEKKMFK